MHRGHLEPIDLAVACAFVLTLTSRSVHPGRERDLRPVREASPGGLRGCRAHQAACALLGRRKAGYDERIGACLLCDAAFERWWLALDDNQNVIVSATLPATPQLHDWLNDTRGRPHHR